MLNKSIAEKRIQTIEQIAKHYSIKNTPFSRLLQNVNDAEFVSLINLFGTDEFDYEVNFLFKKYTYEIDSVRETAEDISERMNRLIDLDTLRRVAGLDD